MDPMRRTVVCYKLNFRLQKILSTSIFLDCIIKRAQTWAAQQALASPNWLLSLQTVGGACSRRRALSAVRMLRRASSPGRSASTSKTLATCVERPSSVHAGWSLLPTVCKMTARRGNSTLTISGHERSLVFRVMWLKLVNSCKSLGKDRRVGPREIFIFSIFFYRSWWLIIMLQWNK